MSYTQTSHQEDHTTLTLHLLQQAHGGWLDGAFLTRKVGTTNLSARLGSLKAQGWDIRSRKQPGSDFYQYKLVGRCKPPGRSELRCKLPPAPGRRAWTEDEVSRLQTAADEAVAAVAQAIHDAEPKPERDWLDFLFDGEDEG